MSEEKREILEHLVEYLQDKIDTGYHKIFYNDDMYDEKTIDCINAINDTLEENKRLHSIIKGLDNTIENLNEVLQQKENIIKEVREYIDNLKPLTIVETSIKEELKSAYNPKETSIKGTDEYFNAVCHLEDFEIAIWNIKEILDKENK